MMDLKAQLDEQPTGTEDYEPTSNLATMDFVERCFIVAAMTAFLALIGSIAWMWMHG